MSGLPEAGSTFFWVYICSYVGGIIRWQFVSDKKNMSFKEFLKDKYQMKRNIILGNFVLMPLLLIPTILTYLKYN